MTDDYVALEDHDPRFDHRDDCSCRACLDTEFWSDYDQMAVWYWAEQDRKFRLTYQSRGGLRIGPDAFGWSRVATPLGMMYRVECIHGSGRDDYIFVDRASVALYFDAFLKGLA